MNYLKTIYAFSLLSLSACNGDSEPERVVFDNQGALCLTTVNNQVRVQAVIDSCIPGSCVVIEDVSCNASVTGTRIDVSNHLEYSRNDFACTTDCNRATAVCGTLNLAPGAYQVMLGSSQAEVSAPLSASTRVFGEMFDCEFETND